MSGEREIPRSHMVLLETCPCCGEPIAINLKFYSGFDPADHPFDTEVVPRSKGTTFRVNHKDAPEGPWDLFLKHPVVVVLIFCVFVILFLMLLSGQINVLPTGWWW